MLFPKNKRNQKNKNNYEKM